MIIYILKLLSSVLFLYAAFYNKDDFVTYAYVILLISWWILYFKMGFGKSL